MRLGALLPAVLVALAVLGATSSTAAGGIVVTGAGRGDAFAYNGTYTCLDRAFTVQIAYLPDNKAVAHIMWVSHDDCPRLLWFSGGLYGGTVSFDTNRVPPIWWTANCTGSEAAGLDCGDLRIGPYSRAGQMVSVTFWGSSSYFAGEFLAA